MHQNRHFIKKSLKSPPVKGDLGDLKKYLYLPYDKRLVEKARENRKNPTPAEKKIWFDVLRNREFQNLKFTRQKPIDNFIVDFYCAELMLVIEIDGDSHTGKETYDWERTKKLESYGITVVRYTNYDVLNNVAGVYQDLRERITPLTPLDRGEG